MAERLEEELRAKDAALTARLSELNRAEARASAAEARIASLEANGRALEQRLRREADERVRVLEAVLNDHQDSWAERELALKSELKELRARQARARLVPWVASAVAWIVAVLVSKAGWAQAWWKRCCQPLGVGVGA